jgi:hypothetical protein
MRPAAAATLASAFGFLAACLPMLPERRVFADFIGGVITHQGIYGSGPSGFTSGTQLVANLTLMASEAPAVFAALGGILAMLAALYLSSPPPRREGVWAVVLGIVVQLGMTLFLFGKHPSPFYVPALAAVLPPLLAVAFEVARRRGPAELRLCVAISVAVLAGFSINAVLTNRHFSRRAAFREAMNAEVARVRSAQARARAIAPESILILWGPLLPDAECYARWMSIQYAKGALARQVAHACPTEGLAWSNSVAVADEWRDDDGVPATIVTTETALRLFPAFGRLGPPQLGSARDLVGARLVFIPATLDRGTLGPPSRDVP